MPDFKDYANKIKLQEKQKGIFDWPIDFTTGQEIIPTTVNEKIEKEAVEYEEKTKNMIDNSTKRLDELLKEIKDNGN